MSATVVSISGPSGSGKSSLINAIVKLLPNSCSLHFDDYKDTTRFPDDLSNWVNAGCNPDDFETPKMVEDLKSFTSESRRLDNRRGTIWPGANSTYQAY